MLLCFSCIECASLNFPNAFKNVVVLFSQHCGYHLNSINSVVVYIDNTVRFYADY